MMKRTTGNKYLARDASYFEAVEDKYVILAIFKLIQSIFKYCHVLQLLSYLRY